MSNSGTLTTPLVSPSSAGTRGGEVEPLLEHGVNTGTGSELTSVKMKPWASFVNNVYDKVSNLANLLPTGTYLAFTTIAPIITDNGTCDQPSELWLTAATTIFFAAFCFFSCFSDSFQAADGQVYYGIVTFSGLWTPQLPTVLHPGDKEQYKLTFIDFIHAALSAAVFGTCALLTPNIRSCLYPNLSDDLLRIIPALVSLVVSWVFTAFPSTRHGIGFPVTTASTSNNNHRFFLLIESEVDNRLASTQQILLADLGSKSSIEYQTRVMSESSPCVYVLQLPLGH